MTSRSEDVVGGIADALEAIKPEPGEILVLRLARNPDPYTLTVLHEWMRDNLGDTPALVATPDADVAALTAEQLGLELWGSDCQRCGNTTPGSQRCDQCNSTAHTKPMWVKA